MTSPNGEPMAKLRAVPGYAGHLFFTYGSAGGTTGDNPNWDAFLWRSTDGGTTWTTVPGVGEPYDVAVGKAAPGTSYPAVYFTGWYNGVYGVWRSTDNCATFTQIASYPLNSIDLVTAMAASLDVFGDVYLAFQGSGWAYGKLR